MVLEKMKKVFRARSTTDLIIIFIVFGLAGSSTAWIADLIKPWFGLHKETSFWLKALFFVVATLPIYQVVLLAYGLIFFRFNYFWNFEKKMFSRWFGKKKSQA